MDNIVQEIIYDIKNGFVEFDAKEIDCLSGKQVLVIGSAGVEILKQLMEKFLLQSGARITISGPEKCKCYIDEAGLENIEYFFHEGLYNIDSLDYKILKHKKFDVIIYLMPQKDLYSYINVEELCHDYSKSYDVEIYCADAIGKLWKNRDINRYMTSKKAYKALIDYIVCLKKYNT